LTLILGIPQASGGIEDMPGMPSSEVMSRTNADSRPNVLKNELKPNLNSLTTVGESVRVLPTIA
jgi:hypothetical protein